MMDIAVWVVSGVLAVLFFMAGAVKLMTPYDEFTKKMPWGEDFQDGQIKVIGVLEVLGAIGLILPPLHSSSTNT